MTNYRTPESIWRDMGITSPAEADIEVMAYFCGATVKYRKLGNYAARIVGHDHKAIITVDESATIERQRFSVGHELGHWIQDKGDITFKCKTSDLGPSRYKNYETDREAAANRFAVELLMPKVLFKEASKNQPMTMETARHLSKEFVVSLTAAAIRLVELGSFPAIIVCNDSRGYKWSWRHPELPLTVKVRRLLSKHTDAYRLLTQPNAIVSGPIEVDADDWVEHNVEEDYVVVEDSVRINHQSVLSLIWWKNEKPLLT